MLKVFLNRVHTAANAPNLQREFVMSHEASGRSLENAVRKAHLHRWYRSGMPLSQGAERAEVEDSPAGLMGELQPAVDKQLLRQRVRANLRLKVVHSGVSCTCGNLHIWDIFADTPVRMVGTKNGQHVV